ncbi:cytochrome P450 [Gautieria morchelliformis]|nr:cytochrome P450 [Gautieria morchelliformis]
MASNISALVVLGCLLTLYLVSIRVLTRKRLPLPPGPLRWPLVGNVFNMPQTKEWIKFAEWQKVHGDMIYLSVFNRSIVVLNSAQAAIELLGKRSSIYSDRPRLMMAGDLIGWDRSLALIPYSERFRQTRRLFHSVIGPRPAQIFWKLQEKECGRFLCSLLDTPDQFLSHIQHTAGAIILSISHGYDVSDSQEDPLVTLAELTVDEFSMAVAPGAFLVDFLPWLKYVPAFLPGMGFKKKASIWRKDLMDMAELPYEFTKSQMAKGQARTSFTSRLLENGCTPESEPDIKWAALSMYSAGSTTVVSSIMTFFLAMCTHPQVQLAAQAEIDSVIGSERLPLVSDRSQLPYIDAMVKEILRWGPIAPLGLPHRLMKDDAYEGFRIPAGSLVIANIWWMLNDPKVFPSPSEFRPERFLEKENPEDVTDPSELVFGFGRRICPGQHLAEPFLFLSVAMTLAAFTITKAVDDHGNIIEPEIEWMPGTISHPKPFKCQIKPRSTQAVALIRRLREQKD